MFYYIILTIIVSGLMRLDQNVISVASVETTI
jgi:hypothetical protein